VELQRSRAVQIIALTTLLLATACAHSAPPEQKPVAAYEPVRALDARVPNAPVAAPPFSASRAMEYVKEIVAYGPRPLGSKNHEKVENYILSHLNTDTVERDDFEINSAEGHFSVHNILAKFPGTRDGIIVIASHYDTNWPLRDTAYVGANDGASSSALLLEIANQLRGKK
jgi:hypothetical protein